MISQDVLEVIHRFEHVEYIEHGAHWSLFRFSLVEMMGISLWEFVKLKLPMYIQLIYHDLPI